MYRIEILPNSVPEDEIWTNKNNLEKRKCKICHINDLEVIFLPCGHIVSCIDCSSLQKICIICGKNLKAAVRVRQ